MKIAEGLVDRAQTHSRYGFFVACRDDRSVSLFEIQMLY